MNWRELILMRVSDLEPGQRVRMPRMSNRSLQTVVSVHENDAGAYVVQTDIGAYVCDAADMVGAECNGECYAGAQ